jgi:hypothetical protein
VALAQGRGLRAMPAIKAARGGVGDAAHLSTAADGLAALFIFFVLVSGVSKLLIYLEIDPVHQTNRGPDQTNRGSDQTNRGSDQTNRGPGCRHLCTGLRAAAA